MGRSPTLLLCSWACFPEHGARVSAARVWSNDVPTEPTRAQPELLITGLLPETIRCKPGRERRRPPLSSEQ